MNITLPMFVDGCPNDHLENGKDQRWHTYIFVCAPNYSKFLAFGEELRGRLGGLNKWKTGASYQDRLMGDFCELTSNEHMWINAVSFKEKDIRLGWNYLTNQFGIAFEEGFKRDKPQLTHHLLNFKGYSPDTLIVNRMLPVLVIAWSILKQFHFYKEIIQKDLNCDKVNLQVICNMLSGDERSDDDKKLVAGKILANLLDLDGDATDIYITFHDHMNMTLGDYLTDNLEGWFNECLMNQVGKETEKLLSISNIEKIITWHELNFKNAIPNLEPMFPQLAKG